MEEAQVFPHLRETLLFLALAGLMVPLLQRMRVGSVPGFLAVGMLVGPFGLGRLADESDPFGRMIGWLTFPQFEAVSTLAGIGVIFLMFMIGLELSAQRLWNLRHWVFAAGVVQLVATAGAIAAIGLSFGMGSGAAIVVGLALSFSSTAIVVQLLSTRGELGTPLGQASFAVLLFQDLAVVPVLILVGLLARSGDVSVASSLLLALAKAAAAIVVIFLLGRVVLRPLFRHFSANRQSDTFMALVLLSSLGIASLTWLAGLSMALGAMLAGLLLAETEYRHQVEVTVDPFRGLLMGLFFLSVGMAIDPLEIVRQPIALIGSVAALFLLKAVVLAIVMRAGGQSWSNAMLGGLMLGQGGEFAFVVFGAAMTLGLLSGELGRFLLLVVGLSMFATPWITAAGRSFAGRAAAPRAAVPADEAPLSPGGGNHVVIAGFGRVGQLLGQLLDERGIRYVAIDPDAEVVGPFHARGRPVYVGDASRTDMLRRLGLERASSVVVTMDHPVAAVRTARCIRKDWPEVPILARARDERHAAALREAGADAVIPEALESALQLAALALGRAGIPGPLLGVLLDEEREQRIAAYRGGAAARSGATE